MEGDEKLSEITGGNNSLISNSSLVDSAIMDPSPSHD